MSARRPLAPRLPRDAWVVLGGDMLSAMGSGLTLPFFLVYLNRIRGIDLAIAGLALSTVALVGFVGNPLGGWLTDRVGAKGALVAGLVVATAGAFLVTLVREPWQAFASAAVVGLGAAVIWPAQDALLAVVVSVEQRSSVFAVRNATLNAGYGLGAVAAALIADLDSPPSFVTLYVLDGLTFLAFIPVLTLALPHVGAASSPEPATATAGQTADATVTVTAAGGYRAVLKDLVFLRLWVLIALLVTVGFAQTQAGFPAYATGAGGLAASGLAIAFAANTFTVVAAQLPVLRLMEGRRRTTGIVVACFCWAAAWSVTLLAGGLSGGAVAVVVFTAALVVFALGETFLAPSQAALVNDLAPDHLRGRYNGLYSLAWTTGFALGPAVAGVVLGAGRGGALFVGLVVGCAVAALGALVLARHLSPSVDLVAVEPEPLPSPPG